MNQAISLSSPAFELAQVNHVRVGRTVLRDISLTIPKGRTTSLIGPSGSGKTSLLRLLNRLESPVSGSIRYAGRVLEEYPIRELRRRVAFAFQTPAMLPGTVLDNLLEACRCFSYKVTAEDNARAMHALQLAELPADYLSRPADRLSGGEKQRVALARALMTEPDVLLLDEPTSALDPDTSARLVATLSRLTQRGLTIVMATHRLEEARLMGGYVAVLQAGCVVDYRSSGALETAIVVTL